MKKFFLLAVIASAFTACVPHPNTIVNMQTVQPAQCVYTVAGDVPYTFIDSCGKYKIGEVIK